jgi:hypothetical protein
MTVSFKTFSENIIEANATQNISVFNDLSPIGKGAIVSVGSDVASFGAVGWGRTNSKGSTSKGSTSKGRTDNPMQTYFNNNSNSSKLQTKNTLGLLRATPGLLPTENGEDEGNGDESRIIFKLQMQDGDDSEADGSNAYTGMNTDALYFGDPGDDEQMETIYKTALYRQQEAQQRWKKLKNWIKSIGVDPSIQSKIASPTAVLSINTPAIMKGHHYYKDLKDLKNKIKKGKG